jgi:hypothetical protein
MRVLRTHGERIQWENGFVGTLFSPGIRARAVLFDRTVNTVVISKGLFRKTVREIPFRRIRGILHTIYAPIHVSPEVPPVRMESDWSEISLLLAESSKEVLFQENYVMDASGKPGREAIRRILGMAEEIAEVTGKPLLVDWEEAEMFLDKGAAKIQLTGDLIPPQMRGREIPFRKVEALQAVKTEGGYNAVRIATRDGDIYVTTQWYDRSSCLDETTEAIARCVHLPFQKVATRDPGEPVAGRMYAPITPSMRGTVPGR